MIPSTPLSEANPEKITEFVPGPNFARLPIQFDPVKLREGLDEVLSIIKYEGIGVRAICLTQIPGDDNSYTGGNLRGIYWTRPDTSYQEVAREQPIDEEKYSQFVEALSHTYFKEVYDELSRHMKLGRMRILKKDPRSTLSWHRDPEPRIHIPIITNPGSLMIINNHCTHLPADGSVYFTDTRGYHTAVNGGEEDRIHIVATVIGPADNKQ